MLVIKSLLTGGWSVVDLSQDADRCTTLAAASYTSAQLPLQCSLDTLAEAYCDAVAGGLLLEVGF